MSKKLIKRLKLKYENKLKGQKIYFTYKIKELLDREKEFVHTNS